MKTGCAFCGHKELRPCQTQYIYRYDGKFLIVDIETPSASAICLIRLCSESGNRMLSVLMIKLLSVIKLYIIPKSWQ